MTSDRLVLVTGAAKRVGRAIALHLGEAGYDVVVHYRGSQAEAEATVKDIQASGVEAWSVQGDLGDVEAPDALFAAATEAAGRAPGFLMNNASSFARKRWEAATYEDVDQMMRLHAWAPQRLMQCLHAAGGEAAVNILDTRVNSIDVEHGPYLLSKQALWHLTKDAARRLAPMRVNAVAPGPILEAEGGDLDAAVDATVLKRQGAPQDVAEAVAFLLEDHYVTGHTVFVDGGRHLRG